MYTLHISFPDGKNIESKGGHMPLRYCNLHERVFAEREHKWIDFSRYKMKLLKNFFDLHYALGYEIVEASCDQCDEIARQMLQKLFDASEL